MGLLEVFKQLFSLFSWDVLAGLVVSTILGIVMGALPGLTATMGIALLTGLTFSFRSDLAFVVLMGIYVGAIYGGSISAVLLNIPGTAASAGTAMDGYPLARSGHGKEALFLTRIASFIGTIFGLFCLALFAPIISGLSERYFASPEYFLLALFGIMICGSLTSPDKPIKGWIAGCLGLMISFVGSEEIYGYQRFTFGNSNLISGIAFIPAMIGVFGISQMMDTLKNDQSEMNIARIEGKVNFREMMRVIRTNLKTILRSGLIGVGVGSIPGVGEDVACWLSYDQAKKSSDHPEKFGTGIYEGIIACETGNNACIGGAIIPLLTLGVPGSPPAAVLLGALMLHGVRPGPMLTFENPTFIYKMVAILVLCAIALLLCGLFLSSIMVNVLKANPKILMPIVGALSVIGAYAINVNRFDIRVMVIAGVIGFFLIAMGYPSAPLILGTILGSVADSNLRRTFLSYGVSFKPFVTRPIAALFFVLIIWTVVSQMSFYKKWQAQRKGKKRQKKEAGT